jgi:precorrin-6A synthase (deacetylating)
MADGVMKKVLIIGIGAGNPDYVTVQAINALNEVDVFFVIDKGKEREELFRLRKEICERYVKDKSYRTIEAPDPPRDRSSTSYQSAVASWHEQRADLFERLIGEELHEDECGAFLVWGDPSLYDSTLRIIDRTQGYPNRSFRADQASPSGAGTAEQPSASEFHEYQVTYAELVEKSEGGKGVRPIRSPSQLGGQP